MSNHSSEKTVPPWLYKLFTGHQYPYVRRQAKFAQRALPPGSERGEPTKEEIESKFWEIYPRCWIKVLEEVKTGMIVVFPSTWLWLQCQKRPSRTWWLNARAAGYEIF